MWTDAKHLAAWWGPHGWTNPRSKADARPGGKILIHMHAPDGTVYPMTGTFREVVVPARLVFSDGQPTKEVDGTKTNMAPLCACWPTPFFTMSNWHSVVACQM